MAAQADSTGFTSSESQDPFTSPTWANSMLTLERGLLLVLLIIGGCDAAEPRLQFSDADGSDTEGVAQVTDEPDLQIRIDQIRRIGWLNAGDSVDDLTDTDREYQGGVLSAVADVKMGPDDSLFVLDRDYQKIVVFGPEGSFGRLILGGYGSGPGEFNRPRSLTLTEQGEIAVIDRGNSRLTLLSRSGEYISSFRTAQRDRDLASRNDTLFVTQFYQSEDDSSLDLYTLEGEEVGGMISPTPEMVDLSLHGEPGILNESADGTLLFASPEVGIWYESSSGPFVRRGQPLFSDLEGQTVTRQRGNRSVDLRVTPAAPRGILRTSEGLTLIIFTVTAPDRIASTDLTEGTWMAVFNAEGIYSGKAHLFGDSLGAVYPTLKSRSDRIYFHHWDPYPHIAEYQVDIDMGELE